MAARKKPVRRPVKKAAAKKTNSKISEAQKATNEVRKERDSLRAQSASEHRRLAAQKKADSNPKLEPRTGTPMANSGRGVDQDKVKARDEAARAGKSMSEAANKIVGLAAPVMESMQAKARAEKKPLSDPSLYGSSNKDRAAKIAELMQKQVEQSTQAVKKTGDAVFMGQKKIKIRSQGPRRMEDIGGETTTTEVGPDDILTKQELLSWLSDGTKLAEIKRVANDAGIAVETYEDIAKLWGSVVDMAASSYSFAGKKVTPWSIIQLRGKYMGADGKPTSKTVTSTSIDEMSPEQARLLFERTASDQLGRSATKAEIDDFIAKAQTIAKANPAVTKTTQQIGFDGNVESQQSVTTGGAEAVNAKSQIAAMDQAKQSEDYAAYQAAGNYFPMLFEALNSPV